MAKIILASEYYNKPSKNLKGFVEYVATRKNVEVIHLDPQNAPVLEFQERWIKKFIGELPSLEESLEYEDYKNDPSFKTAHEFLNMALEHSYASLDDRKSFVEYMGKRTGVELMGTHGLFTESGIPYDLNEVSEKVGNHTGLIFSHVVSLRREDAERMGYDSAKAWQSLVDSKSLEIAKAHKIPHDQLRYAAAFHNESHHPHIHMIVYSEDAKSGYLTNDGIESMRSMFANEVFKDEMYHIYETKSEKRDELSNR